MKENIICILALCICGLIATVATTDKAETNNKLSAASTLYLQGYTNGVNDALNWTTMSESNKNIIRQRCNIVKQNL